MMDGKRLLLIGLLLAAIALAGCTDTARSTSDMGVNDACPQKTPSFTGKRAAVSDWVFTGTNSIRMDIQASTNITVTAVGIRWKNSEAWSWTGKRPITTDDTVSITVDGSSASPGECLSGDVFIKHNTEKIIGAIATGDGTLQGKTP